MLGPYKSLQFVLSDDESPDPDSQGSEAEKSCKHMRSSGSANSVSLSTSSSATNITTAGNDSNCERKSCKPVGARQLVGRTIE